MHGFLRFALRANLVGSARQSAVFRRLPRQCIRSFADSASANAQKIETRVNGSREKVIGRWLIGCAAMCSGAVILGGITRLTESGLSMVNWDLVKDMKPPSSEVEWAREFTKYQEYPEYQHHQKNGRDMTLSEFKFIYYMEFAHRMWGRLTGLVFIGPAAYFLYKGWISKSMKPRLFVYAALLGFQGFLGWYMVKSGLEERPDGIPRVSQYRLASHLGSAFLLFTLFLWAGLGQLLPADKALQQPIPDVRRLQKYSHGVMGLIFFTAIAGAFVAGLDAGLTYNTWPKMADKWIPDDLLALSPKWKNFFENPTTVQFNHRHLGEFTAVAIGGLWWVCRRAPLPHQARLALNCLVGMAGIQVALGITTLLTHVHLHVAASHQAGSLVLLTFAVWLAQELKRLPK